LSVYILEEYFMKAAHRFSFWARILFLALFIYVCAPLHAHADAAPPEQPPGTNIVPGSEMTQVRMVAETVNLTVLSTPSPNYPGQAKTEAVFMMLNLGTAEESMEVRFPLTFWNNESDGYGNYPEIPDIEIQVDGQQVQTHRIEADFTAPGGFIAHQQAPWAAFDVTFPPGKNVVIGVKYTTNGYGHAPYFSLRYILETGAGWNGTIGTADIIVTLPYEASSRNILSGNDTAEFAGKELRWHFENLEPTADDNINVSLVQPVVWKKVLDYSEYVREHPNDGEGWGQLGKAYKEAIRFDKGYLREDPVGEEMYRLSVQAYEKAVTILPDDALWHYGFADLLWAHYFFTFGGQPTAQSIPDFARAVDEIRQSLALDPGNQQVKDFAGWVASQYPWAVRQTDQGFDYLILTATPTFAPDTFTPSSEPSSTPVAPPIDTPTPAFTPVPPAKTDAPGTIPVCGGAVFLLPVLAGLLWLISKRH
jgi:tetratricopeptide (TPR) repeat protein